MVAIANPFSLVLGADNNLFVRARYRDVTKPAIALVDVLAISTLISKIILEQWLGCEYQIFL